MAERAPLTALDFVQMYLSQTEGHPANGHYLNAVVCRRKWDRKDDSHSRCTRCDGEALLREAEKSDPTAYKALYEREKARADWLEQEQQELFSAFGREQTAAVRRVEARDW